MELRRAEPDDYDAIGRLTVAAYEPFLRGPDDQYVERLADVAGRDSDAEVWVAVEDGDLLGNVTVCPAGSPWREVSREDEGEFRMLAVSPAAQGRGVGRALTDLVVERFRAEGAGGVALCSLTAMTSAHRLYERLGFVRTPDRDWSPYAGVDLIAYALEL